MRLFPKNVAPARHALLGVVVTSFSIALFGAPLQAQDVPTAGEVQETLERREEIRRPEPAPVESRRPTATAAAPGGRRITISEIEFRGNTLFTDAELTETVADWLGRPITLLEIYEAADAVTRLYGTSGYSLAECIVPAQKVRDGHIILEVLEGRIGTLGFDGTKRYDEAVLRNYLSAATEDGVYEGGDFEQQMLIVNDLPGLTARAVLRPGEEFGESDIVIRAKEQDSEATFLIDNHNRETLGEWRVGLNYSFLNPAGDGDRAQVALLHSEQGLLDYLLLSYDFPMNYSGTRMQISYGHAEFEVGGDFSALGIEGKNQSGRLMVTHPLKRSRTDNLSVTAGVSRTQAGSGINGVAIGAKTRITLLEASATMQHVYDNLSVSQVSLGFAGNFSDVDDQPEDDQPGKFTLGLQHLHPLFWSIEALFRGTGVYSADPLVDTQKFSLGGPRSIRGYGPSEVRGDRGGLATLEFRRSAPLFGNRVMLSLFGDAGVVIREQPAPGEPARQTLSSLGAGAVFPMPFGSELKLEGAIPVDGYDAPDGRDEGRLWASFGFKF